MLNRAVMLSPDGTLPDWLSTATADPRLYAEAACRVSRWLAANGGPAAAAVLVRRLREGEPFGRVVVDPD